MAAHDRSFYAEQVLCNNLKFVLLDCGKSHTGGYKVDCSNFNVIKETGDLACTREFKQLCGTNGKTYNNECMLCSDKLKLKTFIGIKHKQSCDIQGYKLDCDDFLGMNACTMQYSPHCGSDGFSYGNKCTYCIAQNANPELSLLFADHCYYNKNLIE
ncbi:double-headed protease inhibitor, submandibular gland-like [Pelodytes ibericus]